LISSIINHNYFWKVNLDDYNKLKHKGSDYLNNLSNNYIKNIKIKKSSNKTKNDVFILMLEQINGVSFNIAKCIVEKYLSMSNLIINLNKNKNLLLGLPISEKRKIGKIIAQRIYDTLIY